MARGGLIFLAGFAAAAAAGWMNHPAGIFRQVEQPVNFNHRAHTGEKGGMGCEDCHSLRADGSFTGIPKLESCAACHTDALGDTKAEADFIEQFVRRGREPQWAVYSRQPDNAWFPHASHMKLGKLKCEQCHGKHGSSEKLPPLKVNRLSGYTQTVMESMRMDDCVACHHKNGLKHSCLDCHR